MADLTLVDVPTGERHIGRGVVFYAPEWDGLTDLSDDLAHLGDTEGEILIDPQSSFVYLTTPELRGQAKLLAYEEGKDPVVDFPMFVASPSLLAIIDGTGSNSGGYTRRQPVTKYTLMIMPEEIFRNATTKKYDAIIRYAAGGTWTKDIGAGGVALTAAETRLLNLTHWFWSVHFIAPQRRFRHDEAGKAVEQLRAQVIVNEALPNGHQLYTVGNPFTAAIEIGGGS